MLENKNNKHNLILTVGIRKIIDCRRTTERKVRKELFPLIIDKTDFKNWKCKIKSYLITSMWLYSHKIC